MRVINKNKVFLIVVVSITAVLFAALILCSCAPSSFDKKKKDPVVSQPDILKNGVLKVGVDYGNPPLANDSSKSSGIDIDVASAIADELGLSVEFTDVGASPELALENKKVDIVMGITKAYSVDDVWKSQVYLESACALFTKNGNFAIPTKEGSEKISTQMASPSALVAQAQFNVSNIKLENSLESAFDDLKNGDVKYVASDSVIGTYYSKEKNLDTSIVALISKPSGYCVGVASSNVSLTGKISGVLDNLLKSGIIDAISKRWIGKSINLSSIPLTPEASNQADAGELAEGVYGQTGINALGSKETQ